MYPPHFTLEQAIRPDILALPAFITSTSDVLGPRATILLDANENALGTPFKRPVQGSNDFGDFSLPSPADTGMVRDADPARKRSVDSDDSGVVITDGSADNVGVANGFYNLRSQSTISKDGSDSTSYTASTNDSLEDLQGAENGGSLIYNKGRSIDNDIFASLHRYPSATQHQLKSRIADWKGIQDTQAICLGTGAADLVDLLIRTICVPYQDFILVTPPTFGLYKARADVNGIKTVQCPLKVENNDFVLPVDQILETLSSNLQIKLIFLASPGNPTGTLISLPSIQKILTHRDFKGILVVDEAYIDFCPTALTASATTLLREYSNLIILQTLSKTLGLAGIRLGMAYGHPSVITQLHKIQMPFCIPTPTTIIALRALSYEYDTHRTASRAALISAREKLMQDIDTLRASDIGLGPFLGGSQANFIVFALLKRGEDGSLTRDNAYAKDVTQRLMKEHSISVRFIGELYGCEAAVRVTVGREWENRMFCEALRKVMGC